MRLNCDGSGLDARGHTVGLGAGDCEAAENDVAGLGAGVRVIEVPGNGAEGDGRGRRCRVAAYCRVSTWMGTQDVSIEGQAAHYVEWIGSNPDWELAGIYAERGRSATSLRDRKALAQLVSDAVEGKIDLIVTKSISRFARNTVDCLSIVRRLMAVGVRILFEKEGIDTGSMESELMLSIMSCMAEEESRSISENVRWGIKRRYEDGSYRLAVLPYGYCRGRGSGREIEIIPEEAEVVRYVFRLAADGVRPGEAARMLNGMGLRTRRGSKWSDAAIRYMLSNTFYTGELVMQKFYREDYVLVRNSGERPQYRVAGHHPEVVSVREYEAAQAVVSGDRAGNVARPGECGTVKPGVDADGAGWYEAGCGSRPPRG